MSGDRVELLGCPFDPVTMEEAVVRCLSWCESPGPGPRTVMTINAAMLVSMKSDAALRDACVKGDLIVADGVPVVWVSKLLRRKLRERVAGVDLMAKLLEAGAERRVRVFFLGAKEQVVRRLVQVCAERHRGLVVAGYRNGYFGPEDHAAVIRQIRESGAQILFVGMPTPFKETWCEAHRDELGAAVIMGVGGSFDVLAGFVKRAPGWMQAVGMEWFWRLMMEPRKLWKRYLKANPAFAAMVVGAWWREGPGSVVLHRSVGGGGYRGPESRVRGSIDLSRGPLEEAPGDPRREEGSRIPGYASRSDQDGAGGGGAGVRPGPADDRRVHRPAS